MNISEFTEHNYKKDPRFRALCSAMASCDNQEEVADLLRDVGTLSELQAWSERLEVAKQLSQGKTYRDVAKNTGASTTTVTRVAKTIRNGTGAYVRLLKKVQSAVTAKRFETPEQSKPTILRKYLDK